MGDLDNDGSLEIVINTLGGRPSLLKNYGTKKHWLMVQPAPGCTSTRAGVG